MDQTQFDTIYALTLGIRDAVTNGSPETVDRLARAIQYVLTGLSIEDEK